MSGRVAVLIVAVSAIELIRQERPAAAGQLAATVPVSIRPGENIQARVNAAPPGTTFLLKSGVHRLQSIVPKDGNTFLGESGAVLSGALLLRAVRSGSYWVVPNQGQEGPRAGTVADETCRPTAPRCGYPEDLFINDVMLQHVSSLPEVGPGKWYFDYAVNQIYFFDNPTGKRVETSVMPYAFRGTATGVLLRNLVVEKYASPTQQSAIELGPGWTIEDSEVRWNHFAGIGNGSNSIARRVRVHHNGAFGFHGAGENILVTASEISFNGIAGYNPFWGSGGAKWVWTTRLVVRGNSSRHNLGPGLWTDINNIYSLYENNTIEDNERGGIVHEISYDATIRNNLIRRNGSGKHFPYWTTGAGVEVISSRNVEVYGNVLDDNWQGITGLDDHRGSGNDGPWTLVNFHVHDNTIRTNVNADGAGRTGVIDTDGNGAFLPDSNNRFWQNAYTLGSRRQYFLWMGMELDESEWRRFEQDASGTFVR